MKVEIERVCSLYLKRVTFILKNQAKYHNRSIKTLSMDSTHVLWCVAEEISPESSQEISGGGAWLLLNTKREEIRCRNILLQTHQPPTTPSPSSVMPLPISGIRMILSYESLFLNLDIFYWIAEFGCVLLNWFIVILSFVSGIVHSAGENLEEVTGFDNDRLC